ncbi:cardiolipin synthase [Rehaibacterium terrae]|jgi:cardiolipin synthase|uniref:Cardiolipin synthase n=1 Tax=Rehaibacterium terrae TaxID=1341696 RepID=A0A7W7XZW6_9GAMM|nr:cardiolipin synthase [Rehaibacterium terrae]MBB5015516.1 cardiolipin synthase [Rehaibacterium terrae]
MGALAEQIPHLNWLLTAGYVVYLLAMAGWIVLQKREPVATLSWILGLALLPVLGFVVYYVFGPQRIRRQRLKRLRSRAALRSQRARIAGAVPATPAEHLSRLAEAATGFPPSTCTSADLLVGGAATFDALLAAVATAEHHIHLEYYIFEPDRTGTALRDALVARARAGVRVRLLLDALGAARLSRRFLAPLREAGAEVVWFHPLRLRRVRRPTLNLRTHRKLVVIDGRLAFTGGINITDEQDERLSTRAHFDLHLKLAGEVVAWLQLAFLEDWHYATGIALSDERLWPTLPRGDIAAQVLPSGPHNRWEPVHRLHVEAIHQANARVWLVTPYFVPGEAALFALTSAAMRGLDVRLLVPERSDSRVVTAAARSYFDELLAAGVRIYEYRPRLMHAKALLVDEDIALLGSANFDHRSFRLNFELCMLLRDRDFAGRLAAACEAIFAQTRHVRRRPRPPRFPQRLFEATARLLSPLL